MRPGIVRQKEDKYALRIVGQCGQFSIAELTDITFIAEKFGNGVVTATSRGTLEVEGVDHINLDDAIKMVDEFKLCLGGTGKTVRTVTACKGTTCLRGGFDVHKVAAMLDDKFRGEAVPKKFKIGVFGCMNSCGKARSQDLGILPYGKGKFIMYVGGMMGKTPQLGIKLNIIVDENNLVTAVDTILNMYREYGEDGERFGSVINRLGDNFINEIESKLQ